jgi:hypothetical protein
MPTCIAPGPRRGKLQASANGATCDVRGWQGAWVRRRKGSMVQT